MSYEIWSEGKLRQRLAGMDIHFAQRTHLYIFSEGMENEDYCPAMHYPCLPIKIRRLIVLELVQRLGDDVAWVISPLDTLIFDPRGSLVSPSGQDRRRTLQRSPLARKQWQSFHASFPSVHMTHNGGLILLRGSIRRGISCLVSLHTMNTDSELEIVMPHARAIIRLCHDGGIHFGTKNIELRGTLSRVFQEVTGEVMPK